MFAAWRGHAVSAAAAQDLNDELTIIVNAASIALRHLESSHPARIEILEILGAARRSGWKTDVLARYCRRKGASPSALPMEALID